MFWQNNQSINCIKYHYVHVHDSFHLRLSLMVSINWILHHIIWAMPMTLVKKSIWYFDTPLKIWLLRSIPATLCVRWQQHNIWENNFLHELFTSWFQINILRAIRGFAIQGDTKEEKIQNVNNFWCFAFKLNLNFYSVHTSHDLVGEGLICSVTFVIYHHFDIEWTYISLKHPVIRRCKTRDTLYVPLRD